MRIGLVSPPWVAVPPTSYGGTELVVDLLARGLQQAGHEVLLAAAADSMCPVRQVGDTMESDFNAVNDALSLMAHVVRAYRAMADLDVIHDHTPIGPLYAGRQGDARVVVTNHGPFHRDADTTYGRMAEAGTSVVAISHDQARRAKGVEISRVIHHGIDVGGIPMGTGRGGYAAFLGRMDPTKGVVEALTIARKAEVPLRIAAKMRDPQERDYFDSEVRPLLTADHEYVGELSGREKLELVGEAFALLNPIQWPEPFGLVMVEALATGTPVVGTPRGSIPEIVRPGVTGFLGAVEELPALLHRAGELDRAACRIDVETRFSARRMVEDHIALYEDLLAEECLSMVPRGLPSPSILPPILTPQRC